MKYLSVFFILSFLAMSSRDPIPDQYARQAQQERIQQEQEGVNIREKLREREGYKKNDPRLRDKYEPYNQTGKIMRPD